MSKSGQPCSVEFTGSEYYANYADNNRWELRNRTSLNLGETALPADIREWSANLFVNQVIKYTGEALKDSTELLRHLHVLIFLL